MQTHRKHGLKALKRVRRRQLRDSCRDGICDANPSVEGRGFHRCRIFIPSLHLSFSLPLSFSSSALFLSYSHVWSSPSHAHVNAQTSSDWFAHMHAYSPESNALPHILNAVFLFCLVNTECCWAVIPSCHVTLSYQWFNTSDLRCLWPLIIGLTDIHSMH